MNHYDQENLSDENWQPLPGTGLLTKKEAHSWQLVLDSRAVPCTLEQSGGGWLLLVPATHAASALREIRLYEEANRDWPPPLPPARTLAVTTLPTLSVLILLATFHNLTLLGISLPGIGPLDLREIGSAHAEQILAGQWWQCLTALTLHADGLHLLSNLTIGGVFIMLLCRELGSGVAWSLLLVAGGVGNALNAYVSGVTHRSLGASTAVFAAVGILSALGTVRYRSYLRRRWLLPVAGGIALLTVLGTEGEHVDIGAHLFGFCAGISLGLVTEYLFSRFGRPGGTANILLALASVGLVGAAWWLAIMAVR